MTTSSSLTPLILLLSECKQVADGLDEPERSMMLDMLEDVDDRAYQLYGQCGVAFGEARLELIKQNVVQDEERRVESRRLIREAKARGELKTMPPPILARKA